MKKIGDDEIWDCGSPLYDSYELVAVSHLVERHFMILPYLSGSTTDSSSSQKSKPLPQICCTKEEQNSDFQLLFLEKISSNVIHPIPMHLDE